MVHFISGTPPSSYVILPHAPHRVSFFVYSLFHWRFTSIASLPDDLEWLQNFVRKSISIYTPRLTGFSNQHKFVRKYGYDSQRTCTDIQQIFREWFGKDPYDWQLDMTGAILLGLDSVVIAGTGAGKIMPFMMPLMVDKSKKVIIVSPLKILQADQVQFLII